MKQQKTVESRVLEILKECPMSRYDDMLLILHYYNRYGYIPDVYKRQDKGDKSMAEKHIRLKSVYKRDMRDQRRGMVKAKLL